MEEHAGVVAHRHRHRPAAEHGGHIGAFQKGDGPVRAQLAQQGTQFPCTPRDIENLRERATGCRQVERDDSRVAFVFDGAFEEDHGYFVAAGPVGRQTGDDAFGAAASEIGYDDGDVHEIPEGAREVASQALKTNTSHNKKDQS